MTNERFVVLNVVKTDPKKQPDVIELLGQITHNVIRTLGGWISTQLVATSDGASILIYSEWKTPEDIEAMRSDERMIAYFPKIREMATFESIQGQVVLTEKSPE